MNSQVRLLAKNEKSTTSTKKDCQKVVNHLTARRIKFNFNQGCQ